MTVDEALNKINRSIGEPEEEDLILEVLDELWKSAYYEGVENEQMYQEDQ